MGLTRTSAGKSLTKKHKNTEIKNKKVIALAGNPNVGKSTIFNALTGMHQHTGNWAGKTVSNAVGSCFYNDNSYLFVDLPGTYSLLAHSAEEEVARNYICFSKPDAIIVVCDATCLERNLNLVLQTLEITKKVIVCVNLLDEAERKKISVDLNKLSQSLGVSVIGTVARDKNSIEKLLSAVENVIENNSECEPFTLRYNNTIENAINIIRTSLEKHIEKSINYRWLSIQLLNPDKALLNEINLFYKKDITEIEEIKNALINAKNILSENNISNDDIEDEIVCTTVASAENIAKNCVTRDKNQRQDVDRKIDKIITGKVFGYPLMVLLLCIIFWITISGANIPSSWLSSLFSFVEKILNEFFSSINAPEWLRGVLVDGMFRVLGWVVAVMLPPMAIFFPLFTLLEDVGYLPRLAYNLDKPFKKCNACGKQALTMCMGFGCNAAGVVGCRIIDSPRERLLAILTNSFVPCNGRFPAIISVITMFFITTSLGIFSSFFSTIILTAVILLGILMTFFVTKLLSNTILKGMPSSFTLELPSYRAPQVTKVIIRSIFDRTIFVLGRAVAVAAPAGILIWLLANINVDNISLLNILANALDPIGKLMGLDGIILIAFILGFPANEIVIPITVMAYMSTGTLNETANLFALKEIFINNGWTAITAVCFIIFSLMHWPCSTTLITIKKETGSVKWMLASAIIPTICGMIFCIGINLISKIFI